MVSHETLPTLRGCNIPRIGVGTGHLSDDEAERSVAQAIDVGYRLIDTAEGYGNETGVGRAVAGSGVAREELFITTKFTRQWHGRDLVRRAYESSAKLLGTDYIDMFMAHWPNPITDRYVEAFEGMLELHAEGLIRAIGVANFKVAHLERLLLETGLLPDVNQVRVTPQHTRQDLRTYLKDKNIVVEAWGPLGGSGAELLKEPLICQIASQHDKTPAQVALRWSYQLGVVPLVRSTHRSRLAENLVIGDFELTAEDIASLVALDQGEQGVTDSDTFEY
jgi:2,5-diketo-D-gluconate reductase A